MSGSNAKGLRYQVGIVMGSLETAKRLPPQNHELGLKNELITLGDAIQKCTRSGTFVDATEAFTKGVTAWVAFLAEFFELEPQRGDPILLGMESTFQRFTEVISSLSVARNASLSATERLELERFLAWNEERSRKLEMFLNSRPQFLDQYASLKASPCYSLCDLKLPAKG